MSAYKYDIAFRFNVGEHSVEVLSENIIMVAIDYVFNDEVIQPITFVKFRLDKNFIDQIILNKDTGRVYMQISKINVGNHSTFKIPYIQTNCVYELTDDVFAEKTILYDKNSEKEDAYAQITIGLMSETIMERNIINQDCVIKECNMMGAVCYFTYHMPMVIEPFTYNDDISELVIEPQESVKEIIKYLNNIKVFYDTPLRYFMDFNVTYLLSSSGLPTQVEGEESPTVIISVKDVDKDADALELGINYNSKTKCYDLKILSNDTEFYEDNTQDKTVNKLIGVLDPSREQSLPALTETLKKAKDTMKGMMNQIQENVASIGQGINDVIHGKNVIDYGVSEVDDISMDYKDSVERGNQIATQRVEQYYQAILTAASNNNGNGSSGSATTIHQNYEDPSSYYYYPSEEVTEEDRPDTAEFHKFDFSNELSSISQMIENIDDANQSKNDTVKDMDEAIAQVRRYTNDKRSRKIEKLNELMAEIKETINISQARMDSKNEVTSGLVEAMTDVLATMRTRSDKKTMCINDLKDTVERYLDFVNQNLDLRFTKLEELKELVRLVVDTFKERRDLKIEKLNTISEKILEFRDILYLVIDGKNDTLDYFVGEIREIIDTILNEDGNQVYTIDDYKYNIYRVAENIKNTNIEFIEDIESYYSEIESFTKNLLEKIMSYKDESVTILQKLYSELQRVINEINIKEYESDNSKERMNSIIQDLNELNEVILSESYLVDIDKRMEEVYKEIEEKWINICNHSYKLNPSELHKIVADAESIISNINSRSYIAETQSDLNKGYADATQYLQYLNESTYEVSSSGIVYKDLMAETYEKIVALMEYIVNKEYEHDLNDSELRIVDLDDGFAKVEEQVDAIIKKDEVLKTYRREASEVILGFVNSTTSDSDIRANIIREMKANIAQAIKEYIADVGEDTENNENLNRIINKIIELGVAIKQKDEEDDSEYVQRFYAKVGELDVIVQRNLNKDYTDEIQGWYDLVQQLDTTVQNKTLYDMNEDFTDLYTQISTFKEKADELNDEDDSASLDLLYRRITNIDKLITRLKTDDQNKEFLTRIQNAIEPFLERINEFRDINPEEEMESIYTTMRELATFIEEHRYKDDPTVEIVYEDIRTLLTSAKEKKASIVSEIMTIKNNIDKIVDTLNSNETTMNNYYEHIESSINNIKEKDTSTRESLDNLYQSLYTIIESENTLEENKKETIEELFENLDQAVTDFDEIETGKLENVKNLANTVYNTMQYKQDAESNQMDGFNNIGESITNKQTDITTTENTEREEVNTVYEEANDLNSTIITMSRETDEIIQLYQDVSDIETDLYSKDLKLNEIYEKIANIMNEIVDKYNTEYDDGSEKVSYKHEEISSYSCVEKNQELSKKLSKLKGKNNAKIIRNVMIAMLDNTSRTVPAEVDRYNEQLGYNQVSYHNLSGKSTEAGYGYTSYESHIGGVMVDDIDKNINGILSKGPVNEINNTYVNNKADQAQGYLDESLKINSSSTDNSLNSLTKAKETCEYFYELMQQAASSSSSGSGSGGGGGGSSGSGSGSSGPPISEMQHKMFMEEFDRSISEITREKNMMDKHYGNMKESVDKGVEYASNLINAQANIQPFCDSFESIQNDLLGGITNMLGGITDIADSINKFTTNITETINQVAEQGLASLGIGDLSQLANGGIDNISNLIDVAKTGVSHIETGKLDILSSGGHEKVKYVDLNNDNPNKIKAIQKEIELKGTTFSITKDNIDNSVITLNKEYLVNNISSRTEQNGRYLLRRKQEIYIREGDLFICRTIMDFTKIK